MTTPQTARVLEWERYLPSFHISAASSSKASFPTPSRRVRYYRKSDRYSDMPDGRYVPFATKVHCSKWKGSPALRCFRRRCVPFSRQQSVRTISYMSVIQAR
jgi:hypothetical protein